MGRLKLTTAQFVSRATEVHGHVYDYSKSVYTTYHEKVEIVCPSHGSFLQKPAKHLGGRGCPRCAGRKTHAEFLEAARARHGSKYDYQDSVYKSCWGVIKIRCRDHGVFEQVARDHLRHGCLKCSGRGLTFEDFISEAKQQHGDRYSYEKSLFVGKEKKVEIICSKHGSFWQRASSHVKGQGCSKCSRNTSKAEHLWLDHLGVMEEHRGKRLSIKGYKRHLIVDAYDPFTNTVYEFYGDLWHGNPFVFDQSETHRVCPSKGTYGDLYRRTMKREEAIKEAGYNLITIWERDWDALVKGA